MRVGKSQGDFRGKRTNFLEVDFNAPFIIHDVQHIILVIDFSGLMITELFVQMAIPFFLKDCVELPKHDIRIFLFQQSKHLLRDPFLLILRNYKYGCYPA